MGLVIVITWMGALAVLGLPMLILAIVTCRRGPRTGDFWLGCGAALVVGVVVQYAAALGPFLQKGTYSWDLFLAPAIGWQLVAPLGIATLLWFAGSARQQPGVAGIVAGLLFSIPLAIALAFPLGLVIPEVLNLKFEP
jgi:hypothetical protein